MENFNVVSLSNFLTENSLQQALEAFAGFYFNVTPRHQKKSNLLIIDNGDQREFIKTRSRELGLLPALQIIPAQQTMRVREAYQVASLLLLPTHHAVGKIIPEALAFGIPILCYDTMEMREFIDSSCGRLVKDSGNSASIEALATIIGMLYFDPRACRILSQGAVKKYESDFSWNHFEVHRKKAFLVRQ